MIQGIPQSLKPFYKDKQQHFSASFFLMQQFEVQRRP